MNTKTWMRVSLIVVCLMMVVPVSAKSQVNPHTALTYTGPAMCLSCHADQAVDLHASDHYQWQGYAQYMTNGPDAQGKIFTAFNGY